MMSCVKPEVRNILQCCQRLTDLWPWATCTKKLVKFSCVVFESCEQTDILITITSQPYRGKINKQKPQWHVWFLLVQRCSWCIFVQYKFSYRWNDKH